jgi:hypothetical protein
MTRHSATGADGGRCREQLSLPWPPRYVTRPGAEPGRTAEQLADLLTDVWGAARVICASLLDVPQLEFKLAGAEAVYELAELAAAIEQRLADLGTRRPARVMADQTSNGRAQVLAADAATLRIAMIYEVLLLPLLDRVESARDAADPMFDGPTARLLRHGHQALSDTCAWFRTATETIRAALGASAVDAAMRDAKSRTGSTPCTALSRPRTAARDARLSTFADTRDYRNAPDWRGTGSSYQDNLIELIRINRDEIDAIETFALAFFDLVPEASLETLRHLARLTWDESRHAAAGHALLAEHGFDPYDFSCSTIGIRLRAAMDGWDAWAQITLYGELGIIGPMRDIAKAAALRGDERTSAAFSFICSDEVMHLRESRRLLDRNHPAGSLERAAETVRQRAAARMDELNIMPKEKYMSLTAAEIFARLGE